MENETEQLQIANCVWGEPIMGFLPGGYIVYHCETSNILVGIFLRRIPWHCSSNHNAQFNLIIQLFGVLILRNRLVVTDDAITELRKDKRVFRDWYVLFGAMIL